MKINFVKIFFDFVKTLFQMFQYMLIPFVILGIILVLCYIYWVFYYRVIKNIKPIPRTVPKQKQIPLFKTIFYLFPKQLALDYLRQDPEAFDEFGIHMVCGEQGSGKTMTVVYLLQKWKKKYPRMQIYTNMDYKYQDGELEHWKQLIERKNGIYGIANVIDETQTWFSNAESKNVPPSMLGEISQQRKQKKAIIGTAQVFGRMAKPLREQTHFVYLPYTILGCLTIVFRAKAKDYDPENDKFKKKGKLFIFAHTPELRDAYDTYKRISKYTDIEFAESQYSGVSSVSDGGTR